MLFFRGISAGPFGHYIVIQWCEIEDIKDMDGDVSQTACHIY